MSSARTVSRGRRHPTDGPADLVRWGPVVAGVVVGLGVFALLDALWFAIAAGGGDGWVTGNLDWFVGGTAIGSLLVAGFVAGLLSGVRGAGAGLGNGLTTWGLLVVLSLLGGIPGALGLSGALDMGLTARQALWTLFWSLLAGLAAAALGGLLGGVVRRGVVVAETDSRGDDQADSRRDDADTRVDRSAAGPVVDRHETVVAAPVPGARTTRVTGNDALEERRTAREDLPGPPTQDMPAVGSRRD